MDIDQKLNRIIDYILAETEAEKEKAICAIRELRVDVPKAKSLDEEIYETLFELAMPEHINGHEYCAYAIKISVENPDIALSITKKLYPAVAEKFNTTPAQAERAIRKAIENCFDRCDYEKIEKYFGNTISANKGKATNSEFIARIANIIRRRVANS